jgi:alpha-ketoglutarate-dependent taurine dioxygenase
MRKTDFLSPWQLRMTTDFLLHGFAVIRDMGRHDRLDRDIEDFCSAQASRPDQLRVVYDEVRFSAASAGSIAYSANSLAPHTDGSFRPHPPIVVAMICLVPDESGGGTSILIDGYRLAKQLPAADCGSLAGNTFFFRTPASAIDGIFAPMIANTDEHPTIRYRYDAKYRPRSTSATANAALEAMRRLVDAETCASRVFLDAGDVLLIDNRRMLHGRTPLTGRVPRRMVRASFRY